MVDRNAFNLPAAGRYERRASAGAATTCQPLVVVLAAACVGIVLDRWLAWPVWCWWPAAVAAAIGWWLLWRAGRVQWAVVPLLASVTATGAAWHHCRWSLFERDHVGVFAPRDLGPAAMKVRAVGGPRRIPPPPPDVLRTLGTSERTRLEVEVLALRDGERWRTASGRASLLVAGAVTDVRPGDPLQVFARLGATRPPANPGEFDFAAQARADRKLCEARCDFPECVQVSGARRPSGIAGLIDALRTRGDALLWRYLGREQTPLAAAMFLGARGELDPDLRQAFVQTGTVHLLVVSGLHVGILAACLFAVLRIGLVPRGWTLAVVAAGCVLYAATTDGNSPVVRATVMVLAACLATALARRTLGFNTLAAAGLIVLAIQPAELFRAGTQLSFLSVGVLVCLADARRRGRTFDPLQELIARTRWWPVRVGRRFLGRAGETLLATTLIWLVICPLVMARFHLLSPVAVLLGPVLAIPLAVAMASGFGVLAFGWLLPPAAAVLGAACDATLLLMQTCVTSARGWPGSHFWVAGPGNWWLAGFYGAIACWALVPRWRPSGRWCVASLAGWSAAGLLVSAWPTERDRLHCTFLSVGHGTAVVVELPGGKTLLYDAGRLGSPAGAARSVAGFLWSRGITHLDAIVISHADADHYNAVPALLEQFSVGAIYVSPVMFERRNAGMLALREAIDGSGAPLREVWSGDLLRGGDAVRIEVLHPPRRGVLGSANANSIVLAIEYAGHRVLLTGDLESPGLEDLLDELPYDCDVVMAPHHGSASSDPPGFAAWSTPEWTVISGGEVARAGEVAAAYIAAGSQVLHTAASGAVSVKIAKDQLSVDSWHRTDRSIWQAE